MTPAHQLRPARHHSRYDAGPMLEAEPLAPGALKKLADPAEHLVIGLR